MSEEEIKNILRVSGYKATPARMNVSKIFLKHQKPLGVEELKKELASKKQKIDEATIYRTLISLENSKIIRKIDFKKDFSLFEINDHHHHHIICEKCNTIESFESPKIEEQLKEILKKSSNFKKLTEHSFELFGFCKRCSLKF